VQHLREAVLAQPIEQVLLVVVVREQIFDTRKTGARGRVEAVQEADLVKEHRQVGSVSRHVDPGRGGKATRTRA
jgi:hypothetical protein